MNSSLIKYSYICYALIALGQLWLYSLNLRTESFYERVTLSSNEWMGSHIILLLAAILIFPTTLVVKDYVKSSSRYLVYTATALTLLGAISLIGQYLIDLYLIELFDGQSSKSAYIALERIQSNTVVKILFYDLIAAWLLGQILFIIGLFKMKNYPRWALGLYIFGIVLIVLGSTLHELLERLSYILISISLIPIFVTKSSIQSLNR